MRSFSSSRRQPGRVLALQWIGPMGRPGDAWSALASPVLRPVSGRRPIRMSVRLIWASRSSGRNRTSDRPL